MTTFNLSVITPNGKIFDGQCLSVTVPGMEGFFEIQGNHAPMVAALKHSVLTVRQEGKISYYIIGSGVLEVNPKHEVLILVDSAALTDDFYEAYKKIKNDNYMSIFTSA